MDTISVIMTKTMPGSEDGIVVKRFEAGHTYDMEASLAKSFLKSNCAKPAPVPEPAKTPDGGDANKGGKGPDENK